MYPQSTLEKTRYKTLINIQIEKSDIFIKFPNKIKYKPILNLNQLSIEICSECSFLRRPNLILYFQVKICF